MAPYPLGMVLELLGCKCTKHSGGALVKSADIDKL